ncbi:MAG: hypothetical protein QG622_1575 [Actinomycetota bacterium]|nr:hypothetical protein [Actinomycetota bacterium]
MHPAVTGSDDALRQLALRSQVPIWLPWPLPADWLLSGVRVAGDEHTGPVATVLACSGPNPLFVDAQDGCVADLLLVAEQPGVGLAAHLAGLAGVDPGETVGQGSPHLKLTVGGHDTPLWAVETDDVAAYVGEAAGVWFWAIAWPRTALGVLLDQFELRDIRHLAPLPELPHGALSPRIA